MSNLLVYKILKDSQKNHSSGGNPQEPSNNNNNNNSSNDDSCFEDYVRFIISTDEKMLAFAKLLSVVGKEVDKEEIVLLRKKFDELGDKFHDIKKLCDAQLQEIEEMGVPVKKGTYTSKYAPVPVSGKSGYLGSEKYEIGRGDPWCVFKGQEFSILQLMNYTRPSRTVYEQWEKRHEYLGERIEKLKKEIAHKKKLLKFAIFKRKREEIKRYLKYKEDELSMVMAEYSEEFKYDGDQDMVFGLTLNQRCAIYRYLHLRDRYDWCCRDIESISSLVDKIMNHPEMFAKDMERWSKVLDKIEEKHLISEEDYAYIKNMLKVMENNRFKYSLFREIKNVPQLDPALELIVSAYAEDSGPDLIRTILKRENKTKTNDSAKR